MFHLSFNIDEGGSPLVYWDPIEGEESEEGEPTGRLSISLGGGPMEPDAWHLSWTHYRSFLVRELPPWLESYYPGDLPALLSELKKLNLGF